jgi:hypothetical protein
MSSITSTTYVPVAWRRGVAEITAERAWSDDLQGHAPADAFFVAMAVLDGLAKDAFSAVGPASAAAWGFRGANTSESFPAAPPQGLGGLFPQQFGGSNVEGVNANILVHHQNHEWQRVENWPQQFP